MIDAYPLSWPAHWPRNQYPEHSRFDTPADAARSGILRELELLGATNVIISTNLELDRTGRPFARQRAIADTGVAVYFDLDGQQRCLPCDKWKLIQDNLHAIELTISALRGLSRWGAKEIVAAAFQGFQALPAGTSGRLLVADAGGATERVRAGDRGGLPQAREASSPRCWRRSDDLPPAITSTTPIDTAWRSDDLPPNQDAYRQAKSVRRTA
jgi:hypothetical protein